MSNHTHHAMTHEGVGPDQNMSCTIPHSSHPKETPVNTSVHTPVRVLMTGSRLVSDVKHTGIVRDSLIWAARMAVALRGFTLAPDLSDVDVTLVHGAARGADTLAATEAASMGWTTEAHPANWRPNGVYDRSAGHHRNHEMVAAGADIVIGFPLGEARGTRGCLTAAAKAGLSTWAVDLSNDGITWYLSTGEIVGGRFTV